MTNKNDIAFDVDGSILPMSPRDVRQKVNELMRDGDLVAAIFVTNGEIGVQVFGPPSQALLSILEHATRGYRRALRGAATKGH